MSNPQLENGHIRIANEIFEALARTRLSGESRQVLDVVFRKTYGFNKISDKISISQFILMTGLSRNSIRRTIRTLKARNIIRGVNFDPTTPTTYSFNKNYLSWVGGVKNEQRGQKQYWGGVKNSTGVGSKTTTTKDTITKDNNYIGYFDQLWEKYPKRDGRKEAERHFKASVKSDEDLENIKKALENYNNSKSVNDGYIKKGSTWFNNWKDWINPSPHMMRMIKKI